jgi:hypothetical protein
MRICGIRKDYHSWDCPDLSLRYPSPNLDYFIFADKFDGTRNSTNSHYSDLFDKLSNQQSNKLMNNSNGARKLLAVSTNDC